MSKLYENLHRLREGGTLTHEGRTLIMTPGKRTGADLAPGDTYYACRNYAGIYTVREVSTDLGAVLSEERGYGYNLGECVGVTIS